MLREQWQVERHGHVNGKEAISKFRSSLSSVYELEHNRRIPKDLFHYHTPTALVVM
jgi:hypothetical protein